MLQESSTLDEKTDCYLGQQYDGDHLVDELNTHGVFFLRGGNRSSTERMPVVMLFAALALSNEARLRLAVIPLLLRHPEFAYEASDAVDSIPSSAQLTLKFYYTAAVYLQQKYAASLDSLFQTQERLPDLFSLELGIFSLGTPDEQLQRLAERHRFLSGSYINWLGTYEHAAQRFIATAQKMKRWQR